MELREEPGTKQQWLALHNHIETLYPALEVPRAWKDRRMES